MDSARCQRISEWPLTVAALVFLGFYAWAVLADLHGPADQVAQVAITLTWVLFAVDYFVRLFLSERRWRWFGRHLLDLAIVALPILRPLRLVRLLTLLAIFQRVAGQNVAGPCGGVHRCLNLHVGVRQCVGHARCRAELS